MTNMNTLTIGGKEYTIADANARQGVFNALEAIAAINSEIASAKARLQAVESNCSAVAGAVNGLTSADSVHSAGIADLGLRMVDVEEKAQNVPTMLTDIATAKENISAMQSATSGTYESVLLGFGESKTIDLSDVPIGTVVEVLFMNSSFGGYYGKFIQTTPSLSALEAKVSFTAGNDAMTVTQTGARAFTISLSGTQAQTFEFDLRIRKWR